jgi:hypothetical protein
VKHKSEKREAEKPEPTARMVGLWLEPGAGWRFVTADMPRSVAEEHAVEVSEPELLQVALAQLARAVHQWAFGGGGR